MCVCGGVIGISCIGLQTRNRLPSLFLIQITAYFLPIHTHLQLRGTTPRRDSGPSRVWESHQSVLNVNWNFGYATCPKLGRTPPLWGLNTVDNPHFVCSLSIVGFGWRCAIDVPYLDVLPSEIRVIVVQYFARWTPGHKWLILTSEGHRAESCRRSGCDIANREGLQSINVRKCPPA